MKFLGSARALVLAVAVVTEVAGLGLAVLPALAAPAPPPGGGNPDITITAGGDRTSDNAVSGTAGVRFSVPNASPNDCTTASNGTCTVSSAAGSRRTITQESAPAGWFTSPELAISPNSSTSNVAPRDYSALTTNVPQSGVDVPASTSGTTTSPTARSGVWAVSRQEPVIPPHCGLNAALLFDLSFSVQGHLRQVQDAGIGYVNALAGTPSSVALFTMGTHAPVNSTNNSNFPLTPVTTSANVAALTNKIRHYTVLTNPAQYTNLDQGLWQIASAEGPPGGTRVHYDAVIVISDGDPTVYGPTGIGQTFTGITRFIDIENGIFSANALKAEDTKVISVGVNSSSATVLNLRAISGRVEGSDYFVTNPADLEEVLHDLALANCAGSVNVTTAVIPLNSTDTSKAVPAPGWTLHATGATVSPAVAVTNETGASSFTTSAVSEPVNITEEVMSGHKHVTVDGKNAVCTNLEGNPVPVTDTGTSTGPGFTVTTQANDVITCKIYNQQLAPSVVTTKLSAVGGQIPVNGSASDSATLHSVTGTAGGTVQYRYYGSLAACQSATATSPPAGGTLVSTVTVTNGAVPPSAAATFPAAGTFYWAAFYSGDPSNLTAASDCATEPLVVTPAQSRVTTVLSATDGEIAVGGSATDTATLQGVTGTAGGTMRFRYYNSLSACQSATPGSGGTLVSTETVTGGVAPPSAAATFPAAGTFYWAAFYSGDPSNLTAASDCATEPLVVTQAPSEVTTQLSAAAREIAVGGSATDTATLNGVTSTAGGTVQFRHYNSLSACQSATATSPPAGGTLVSTVTVTNGAVPPSAAAAFPDAGTFYWAAFYSGDPSNQAAASDCATEPLVVTAARSQVTTEVSASGGEIPVGGSASDTARLLGVTPTAGGTMEYRYYDSLTSCQSATLSFPPAGGGTPASTVPVTGNGAVAPSATVTFPDAGTFYWAAFYSGDASNQADASHCATEPLVVTQAVSRVTTALSAASGEIPVGGSASDSATLHGVTSTAVGTIEFRHYDSLTACDSDVAAFPGTTPSDGTPVSTQTVTNGAAPPSATATFPTAGTFYWAAFYSGGPNNLPSASDCATEPLVVTPAPSRVTTRLSTAGGQTPVGGSVTDTATLNGVTPTAGGTVEYRYYDSLTACDTDVAAFPGTAPAGGASASTETVASSVVPPSVAVAFPDAGTFYWAAFYSGDTDDLPAASDCATEPLVVTQAVSRVATTLTAAGGKIEVGGSSRDSVTLFGVTPTAVGTVEYRYYDSLSACDSEVAAFPGTAPSGGTAVSTQTVTDGAAPPSDAATFPAAGTFYWAAFYSGGPNNLPSASDCATEPLVVTPAASQVTTALSATDGEITVGGSASDSATLSGVTGAAGGTVDYRYYDSLAACEGDVATFPRAPVGGTDVSTETVTNGVTPPSSAASFPAAGTFYWAAFYSGDANNLPAASDCAAEPLVVTPAPSDVTTRLSAANGQIAVGGTASDSVTLKAVALTAGGTVDYRYYDSLAACDTDVAAFPGTAPSGGTRASTETVTDGVAPSSATRTFPDAGTFYWAAFYSGDPSNQPDASNCAAEPLVVTPAPSVVTTQLSPVGGEIPVDGSASDTVTLTGVTGTAGGTVEYRLYGSLSACNIDAENFPVTPPSDGAPVSTVTVTSGAVPSSATRTFGAAGTFYWAGFYSGDANNRAAASDCNTEPLVVTPAQSQVTTQLSATDGQTPVGGSVSDSATLAGVTGTAGGTVEYRYYDSQAACETDVAAFTSTGTAPSGGTPVSTETVTNGAAPRSSAVTFPDAGTVYWTAFYSGDAANLPAATDCATEPLVVTQAQSRVTTVLSVAGGQFGVGGSASDAATLTGVAGTAGGTVEYRFYDSLSACESDVAGFRRTAPSGGTPVSTETVTNGAVSPSAVRTFPVAGTFHWAAFYSGDPNNRAAASDCNTEPLVVTPAQSQVTTHLSAASGEIPVGGSASDSATLLEVADTASGTVEYRYYDSLSACQSATAASPPAGGTLASTETVTGGVAPQSSAVTFPDAGTFYWAAFYSGDASDAAAASDCATEPLVVIAAQSQVTTQLSAANGEVPVDGTASDSATLTGVTGTASGTVEYRYYDSLSACDSAVLAFPGTAPAGGTLASTETVTSGAVPSSTVVTFPDAGTFYWAAFYSGDLSDQADASDCATEPLVVTPAHSQLTTQLSEADREIPASGSTSDTATLHGVTGTAGGTVEYRYYDSLAACQTASAAFPPASGGTLVSTVTVTDGAVPPSAAHTFSAAGTFYWAAFYSGDPDDLPDTGHCATEPLVVTAAPSQVTTELSAADAEIPAGGSASDTATLNGVTGTAGGTVEYRYYDSPSACDSDVATFPGTAPSGGTLVSTGTVTNGAAPPSDAAAFPVAGTFYWAAFYSGDASDTADASDCATEPLVVTTGPAASVIVNMDWVIDGVLHHVPSQDPDFQASLSLSPLIPPDEPATWGQERPGYLVGQDIHIAVTDVKIPPGCVHALSGHLRTQTLTEARNEYLVTATATCDQTSPNPGEGTHLTLVKKIAFLFPNIKQVPLTSWTLTARRASGGPPVISGTTGVTANVEPGVTYILAESTVPGYKQLLDPDLLELVPGATGSWRCVETGPKGPSGEDFDGGTGDLIVQPGEHVTCMAGNRRTLAIPVGPAQTGGGLAAAARSGPAVATGLALMAAGALLGLGGLRLRRKPRPAPRA